MDCTHKQNEKYIYIWKWRWKRRNAYVWAYDAGKIWSAATDTNTYKQIHWHRHLRWCQNNQCTLPIYVQCIACARFAYTHRSCVCVCDGVMQHHRNVYECERNEIICGKSENDSKGKWVPREERNYSNARRNWKHTKWKTKRANEKLIVSGTFLLATSLSSSSVNIMIINTFE